MRRTRFAAAFLALAFVGSACGGASSETVAADQPEVDRPANDPVADLPTPENTATNAQPADEAAESDTEPIAVATTPPVTATDTDEPAVLQPTAPPAEEASPTADAPEEPAPVAYATVELPSAPVIDLANGAEADLADLAEPGPTLLWFWAPH
ncbi:MAG: hypothetical protein AAF567_17105 [Actinomycetota bacterium]